MSLPATLLPAAISFRKIKIDVLWNIGSLAIIAVGGFLINVLILVFYNADTLGAFNQVYAVFIVFSQFAAGGIHFSTLKYVAEYNEDPDEEPAIICSGLALTLVFALAASTTLWFSGRLIGSLLGSTAVTTGIPWAVPGLFLYAVNKTLISVLNGQQRMKLYAIFQALRPTLMIGAMAVAALLSCPGPALTFVFTFAEVILFVSMLISIARELRHSIAFARFRAWLFRHFNFGLKSFLSGVLFDLNTRVNVLLLGYFSTDSVVGIYSFAAMLAEGFFQLPFILRTNFNPLLVQFISTGKLVELEAFAKKGKWASYKIMAAVSVPAVVLYPLGIRLLSFLGMKGAVVEAWPVFAILMAGILLSAGYLPFGTILQQAGRPGLNTLTIAGGFFFNVLGNILLIPVWLSDGAALAVSCSFVFFAALTWFYTRRTIGVSI